MVDYEGCSVSRDSHFLGTVPKNGAAIMEQDHWPGWWGSGQLWCHLTQCIHNILPAEHVKALPLCLQPCRVAYLQTEYPMTSVVCSCVFKK